ncbi:hypothetical protein BJY00DRAFT_276596, partial [Aspergillus carlsbadensis]
MLPWRLWTCCYRWRTFRRQIWALYPGERRTHATLLGEVSISSISGGPVEHRFFKWMDEDPRINGPFKTLEDFHLDMAYHSQKQEELNNRHPWVSEWFARHLPRVPFHTPTWSDRILWFKSSREAMALLKGVL